MTADIKQVLERSTKRPWKLVNDWAYSDNKQIMCCFNSAYFGDEERCQMPGIANAELIVTAVNSFESNRERLARQTAVIEAKQNAFREQRELIRELTEALEGVIRVADRATVEFDTARAVLTKVREAGL